MTNMTELQPFVPIKRKPLDPLDGLTIAEIRKKIRDGENAERKLGEVEATLIVNCERGILPHTYNREQSVIANLVCILELLLKARETS